MINVKRSLWNLGLSPQIQQIKVEKEQLKTRHTYNSLSWISEEFIHGSLIIIVMFPILSEILVLSSLKYLIYT